MKYDPLDFGRMGEENVLLECEQIKEIILHRLSAARIFNLTSAGVDYYTAGGIFGFSKKAAKKMKKRLSASLPAIFPRDGFLEWDQERVEAALRDLANQGKKSMSVKSWLEGFSG